MLAKVYLEGAIEVYLESFEADWRDAVERKIAKASRITGTTPRCGSCQCCE